MNRILKTVLALTLLGAACHNKNNIAASCTLGATMCQGDRPYVCADGYWRPVGDTQCAPVGGVCCMTASHVHACVRQTSCVGEGQ